MAGSKDSPDLPPLSQGRYVYVIHIARRSFAGGYEWEVMRSRDDQSPRPIALGPDPVCRGTARSCDEAQRKALAARKTIMLQYRVADMPR